LHFTNDDLVRSYVNWPDDISDPLQVNIWNVYYTSPKNSSLYINSELGKILKKMILKSKSKITK
jgi:hypothetical protein